MAGAIGRNREHSIDGFHTHGAAFRKTGYKWLERFEAEGRAGLAERSHVPHTCPHRIAPCVAELLRTVRRAHPSWGPAKLLQWLAPRHLEIDAWPAVSTVGEMKVYE